MPLRIELDSLPGILNVRINTILNNIIVQYNGDLERIQETIYQILLKHIKQCNIQKNEDSYLALRDEIPSSAEVVRATTALLE